MFQFFNRPFVLFHGNSGALLEDKHRKSRSVFFQDDFRLGCDTRTLLISRCELIKRYRADATCLHVNQRPVREISRRLSRKRINSLPPTDGYRYPAEGRFRTGAIPVRRNNCCLRDRTFISLPYNFTCIIDTAALASQQLDPRATGRLRSSRD